MGIQSPFSLASPAVLEQVYTLQMLTHAPLHCEKHTVKTLLFKPSHRIWRGPAVPPELAGVFSGLGTGI